MKIITTLLLLFCTLFLQAQKNYTTTSPQTYIYKITAAEADTFYQVSQNAFNPQPWHFHTLQDSIVSEKPNDFTKNGHYIFVKVEQEDVLFTLKSISSTSAKVFSDKRNLSIQVFDNEGVSLSEAEVYLDEEIIPFNLKTKTYLLEKQKKGGFLKIKTKDETVFYELKKEDNRWSLQQRKKRFRRTPVGRFLTKPYYEVRGFVRYMYQGLARNNWQKIYWQKFIPFYRRFAQMKRNRSIMNGYMVLNKPKYQPGDTVKVKAYLTSHKGKPLRESQTLLFKDGRGYRSGNKEYFKQEITPDADGNFIYEFVLGDSLKINKDYLLQFHKDIKVGFTLEDYQLDEVIWSFLSDKENYEATDFVVLEAEGKDANGNTIVDGEVKLILRTANVSEVSDSLVYIPDTLWTYNGFLKARGITKIIVPDSIFPAAKMDVNAVAEFQNANGETEQKFFNFTLSKDKFYFKEKLIGNSLSIAYMKNGKVGKMPGTLWTYSKEGKLIHKEFVMFPLQKELTPTAHFYKVLVHNKEKKIYINKLENNISVTGKVTKDSLFVRFENPHGSQINYLIQTSKKVIVTGETSAPNFVFARKNNNPDKKYFITYNYIWAGIVQSEKTSVRGYKKLLNFTVEQEKKVLPGATSIVKIKVKDAKGKSAAKVNLTAAAINAQFDEELAFQEPDIPYKIAKEPLALYDFTADAVRYRQGRTKINENWYKTFGLDSLFFYTQRFSDDAEKIHYDTVYQDTTAKNLAQFTPHLLKNGVSVPVYLIYCNRDLVYYYGTNDNAPFAFVGEPGYNNITLRTQSAEYIVDSVFLKKGYKAEVFIDISGDKEQLKSQRIRKQNAKPELSYREKYLLNKSIFQIKNSTNKTPIYLWQDERTVHILPNQRRISDYKVGPFKNNKLLHFLQESNAYHSFKYESDFRYVINKGQEKLYHSPLFDTKKKVELKKKSQTYLLGQKVHTQADIFTKIKRKRRISFESPRFEDEDNGKINIDLKIPKDTILFFCLLENKADSVQYALQPNTRNIFNLAAGNYQVSYYTNNGFVIRKNIVVRAHTATWIQWETPVFVKDLDYLATKLTGYKDAVEAVGITSDIFKFDDGKTTGIIGKIRQSGSNKALPNVAIEVYLLGTLAKKTVTDLDGKYQISLPAGSYELRLKSPTGGKENLLPIFVNDSTLTVADWVYQRNYDGLSYSDDGFTLETVTVISYKVPLVESDNTTQVSAIKISEVNSLPKRNINSLVGKISGISAASDEGSDVSIRGSRSDGTFYYIDGIRVSSQPANSPFPAQSATVGGYEIFGKITDADTGEPILFGDVVLYRNGALVTGDQTDFDGNYRISGLAYGIYDVVFKYVGYAEVRYEGVIVGAELNAEMRSGVSLDEVVVLAYTIPLSERSLEFDLTSEEEKPLTGTQLRTDFKDYAYWQPNLLTDKNGEASFIAKYPDNITSWKTYILGMDRKKRGGVKTGRVKSFKPLMAQLATPRFLIAGDKTQIIGKSVNLTQDSFDIQTQFLMNENAIQTAQNSISEALIENAEITAPNADSLMLTYKLNTETYGDGEQREIPIFPRGTEETVGNFHFLQGDTSLTLNFNPAYGELNIYAENDALEVLLEDLKYLRNYRYGCNEQTASKLTALLLEKEIASQLNENFEHESVINACIARLTKSQNEDGTWGWWSDSPRNFWMTTYVLQALARADAAGYKTNIFEAGLRFMRSEVHNMEGRQLLMCLELFSSIGQNMDYEKELARLDTVNILLFDHLTETKIRQKEGLKYTLDSLQKHERETIFGGIYWGENRYNWQDNSLQLTRLAYEIYEGANNKEKQRKITQFFMEKRGEYYGRHFGRNTFETAQIVTLLLPKILDGNKGLAYAKSTLNIDGKMIDKFPFKTKVNPDNLLTINKSGNGTVFFTAYQKYFNTTPEAKSDLFEIKSELFQKGKLIEELKQGEKAILTVTVAVKKYADYVMIEVPIPAGCSYGNKSQNNYRRGEVHREYFKEKTSIFCRNLQQGEYTFEIELEPRFSGDYTMNPATAEQMYFPVFYGRNGMKQIEVK